MTPNQSKRYWREWSKIRKMLIELAGMSPADADAERHEIHREALGIDKSSKDLTNRDLDKIFDAFRLRLVIIEGPTKAPTRAATEPTHRLIYAIEKLGLPEPYIATITRAEFNTSDWRKLSERELTRLRYTLTARSRALKKKAATKEAQQ